MKAILLVSILTDSLGQLKYKNNVNVVDSDMLNFCKVFCNKIRRGMESGKLLNIAIADLYISYIKIFKGFVIFLQTLFIV